MRLTCINYASISSITISIRVGINVILHHHSTFVRSLARSSDLLSSWLDPLGSLVRTVAHAPTEIQPGAAEALVGEPYRKAAGLRRFRHQVKRVFQVGQAEYASPLHHIPRVLNTDLVTAVWEAAEEAQRKHAALQRQKILDEQRQLAADVEKRRQEIRQSAGEQ